jgi:hypothetical protein
MAPQSAKVLPQMAEAARMIGKAEDLLWPGRRPRPQVAILAPRTNWLTVGIILRF